MNAALDMKNIKSFLRKLTSIEKCLRNRFYAIKINGFHHHFLEHFATLCRCLTPSSSSSFIKLPERARIAVEEEFNSINYLILLGDVRPNNFRNASCCKSFIFSFPLKLRLVAVSCRKKITNSLRGKLTRKNGC